MARVYEAMLLTRHDAPEATQQFLNDYDFSNEVLSEENDLSFTDYDQSPSPQFSQAEAPLSEIYTDSYETIYSEPVPGYVHPPASYDYSYDDGDVLDSDYSQPVAETAPVNLALANDYSYSDVSVDISVAHSLAATVNALTEDISLAAAVSALTEDSVLEAEPEYAPAMAPIAITPVIAAQPAVVVRPVVSVAALSSEPRELVANEYRNDFLQLSDIVLKTSERSPLKVMVVCGVENEDDANFVSDNLSLALAEHPELRVARFQLPSRKHPARAVHPESSFRIKLNKTSVPNLFDITTLSNDVTLDHLLAECDVQQMTNMLKDRFDFVLIVTDAVNFSERVAPFAASTDGVVLVAKKENMYGQGMNTARKKLQGANARILGAVLNRSQSAQQLLQVA